VIRKSENLSSFPKKVSHLFSSPHFHLTYPQGGRRARVPRDFRPRPADR
jgi:hypothetical protein